jgi:hypothetical protein
VAASEVIAVIQSVPGVDAVVLDALHLRGTHPSLNERLATRRAHWDAANQLVRPAGLLVLDMVKLS